MSDDSKKITFAGAPDPKATKNVKEPVRALLLKPKVFSRLEPYITNGGVCDHKMMDYANAVNILKEEDAANGDYVAGFGLSDFKLCNVLKQVLRERLVLDKSWRVVDVKMLKSSASV
jgi:hypothetical protein